MGNDAVPARFKRPNPHRSGTDREASPPSGRKARIVGGEPDFTLRHRPPARHVVPQGPYRPAFRAGTWNQRKSRCGRDCQQRTRLPHRNPHRITLRQEQEARSRPTATHRRSGIRPAGCRRTVLHIHQHTLLRHAGLCGE